MLRQLLPHERETLVELGRKGPGADFDHTAMSKLFTLELVEVRSTDRRLALTKAGRDIYCQLAKQSDR